MRVTSKGQVTIPKHIRRRANIRPGTEVDFAERGGEIVLHKVDRRAKNALAEEEFEAYLDSVSGIVDIGMTTDEFMRLLRGDD